jgi:hypothetical protein
MDNRPITLRMLGLDTSSTPIVTRFLCSTLSPFPIVPIRVSASKPSILIFLDEPTSGLDGQSAYNTVRFLRKLADVHANCDTLSLLNAKSIPNSTDKSVCQVIELEKINDLLGRAHLWFGWTIGL